jgi:hypothetical protein
MQMANLKGSFTLPEWTANAASTPPVVVPAGSPGAPVEIAKLTRVAPGRWVWTRPGFEGIVEAINRALALALTPKPVAAAGRPRGRPPARRNDSEGG